MASSECCSCGNTIPKPAPSRGRRKSSAALAVLSLYGDKVNNCPHFLATQAPLQHSRHALATEPYDARGFGRTAASACMHQPQKHMCASTCVSRLQSSVCSRAPKLHTPYATLRTPDSDAYSYAYCVFIINMRCTPAAAPPRALN